MGKDKEEKPKEKEKDKDEAKAAVPEAEQKKEPTVEEKLAVVETSLEEIKDKYLRTLAEMENFKKRNMDELSREKRYASMPVCEKMIDSLETFDQALAVPTEDPNFKNFLYGFKMIKDLLYGILVEEGVKVIDIQVGDAFDPTIAQAVDKTADAAKNDNVVVKIIKKGYKYKDRLLRPAMVVINMKPSEPEAKKPSDNAKLDKNIA